MITLSTPPALILLPLPMLIWWLVPPHRQSVSAYRLPFFRRIISAAGATAQSGAMVVSRVPLQTTAAVGVWVLLIIGLAGPERVSPPIEVTKSARDLMLAIDISGSMDERDFQTTDGAPLQRLDAVKQIVGDFIASRDGDRVGLIVFGSQAFVQTPFTEDLATVSSLLNSTAVGMAGPHTVIGDALGLAIKTFETSDVSQRLLILMSDGSDTGSRMSPINAAEIAARSGVEVITVGVGRTDGEGAYRLDAETLEDIANRADGRFFLASDTEALMEIYARIEALAPREVETIIYRERHSLAHLAFGLAGLLGLSVLGLLNHRATRASQAK